MVLLALLAVVFCGLAVAALVRVGDPLRGRVAAHLEDLGAYGYAATAPSLAPEPADMRAGALGTLTGRLGDLVARRIGAVREAQLRQLLVGAGMYSTSARTVLGYRVLAAAMLLTLGVLVAHGGLVVRVALGGLLAVGGWMLPLTYVRRRAGKRATEIERQMPDLIDQLVVSLEAGIGFSAALQKGVDRLGGALGRRCGSRSKSSASAHRSPIRSSTCVSAWTPRTCRHSCGPSSRASDSAYRSATSCATSPSTCASGAVRWPEEQAQKTPVKLLLPLIFLILPTIFIVVLVPPMLDLANNL